MPTTAKTAKKAVPRTNNRARAQQAAALRSDVVPAVDTSFLESLLGYNARRAALSIIAVFLERMAIFGLRPVEFSIVSLIHRNPGITSAQLCDALGILPPNLVRVINALDARGILRRVAHPTDRRAYGLHLTAPGKQLARDTESVAVRLEQEAASALNASEQRMLMALLQKIYKRPTRALSRD